MRPRAAATHLSPAWSSRGGRRTPPPDADRMWSGGACASPFSKPPWAAESVDRLVSTNHQHTVEWPRHAKATHSVERDQTLRTELEGGAKPDARLRALLPPAADEGGAQSPVALLAPFPPPPVFQTSYERGYGTLYAAVYRPRDASAE